MKTTYIFIILAFSGIKTYAQTQCEQKLKNAKNSIVAIINSGGSSTKINQTATDVMTNMALNCPEMVKEFNKFIQNLDTKGLDGNIQGNYQTNQQRQKNTDEFFNKQNSILSGQGANGNQSGYNNTNNGGFEPIKNNEDLIAPNDPRLKENRNSVGMGATGTTLSHERQLNEDKEKAINQIQNGSGGFKPVRNEEDLISPKINIESQIKKFESDIEFLPSSQKGDLIQKANLILKTETNPNVVSSKLSSLIIELKNRKVNVLQNQKSNSNLNDLEETETQPQFPGGMQAFYAFLGDNLIYPKEAQNKKVEGKVYLSFEVNQYGLISDISVLQRAGYGFDEEAIRLMKLSPKWIPGTQNGRNIITKFNIPIKFTL